MQINKIYKLKSKIWIKKIKIILRLMIKKLNELNLKNFKLLLINK